MSEQILTYAAVIVVSLIAGFLLRAWIARTKSIDVEAEAIHLVGMQLSAIQRLGSEDEIIAAAEARKAAKQVAIAALKAKVAQL